jgi:hypothetical protein
MQTVFEPGEIIRFHYSPPSAEETFIVEGMILETKIKQDGTPTYWMSTPDVPDEEIPDGDPHPMHGRTEKYRMTGGSVPGITPDKIHRGSSADVRHKYDRDRRDQKMAEVGQEEWGRE